jgi:putative MATE family efflux protein
MDNAGFRQKIKNFVDDRHFFSGLFSIAIPIALQNLISSSVNMLDTIMVGQLGATELAAVGLGNQVYFILMILLFGIGTGSGVFIAQYWGKKDIAGIRRTAGLALTLGMALSLFFLAAAICVPRFILGLYSRDPGVLDLGSRYLRIAAWSYPAIAASFVFSLALRGVERVKLPLATTLISLSTNAVLNYILIFGKLGFPVLGVEGAAIATVISRWMEAAIVLAGSYIRKYPPAGKLREFTNWNKAFVARFGVIVLPVILNDAIWALGITFFNGIFARISTGAIAAYNVQNTVLELAQVLFMGTANACAVMLGKRIGEGNREGVLDWARRFAILGVVLGAVMGLLLVPASRVLPALFRMDPEVLRQASTMVLCLAATFPVRVFNLHISIGICRSGGDTRFGFFFDLFGVWGVGIPLALLGAFVWHLEPWIVFLLTCGDEVAKSGLGLWRLVSKKWLKDVTS